MAESAVGGLFLSGGPHFVPLPGLLLPLGQARHGQWSAVRSYIHRNSGWVADALAGASSGLATLFPDSCGHIHCDNLDFLPFTHKQTYRDISKPGNCARDSKHTYRYPVFMAKSHLDTHHFSLISTLSSDLRCLFLPDSLPFLAIPSLHTSFVGYLLRVYPHIGGQLDCGRKIH